MIQINKGKLPINLDIDHQTVFQHAAYLVTCDKDETVLLAIKPVIRNRTITWYDGGYERAFPISEANRVDDTIILTIKDKFYFFKPLTLEIYQQSVVPKLISPPDINSEEELQNYFTRYN